MTMAKMKKKNAQEEKKKNVDGENKTAKKEREKIVEIKKKASPLKIIIPVVLGLVVIVAGVYLFFFPKKLSFRRLKKGQENIQVVDGLFAGKKFVRGQEYEDIPPEEKRRFEKVPEPQKAPAKSVSKGAGGGDK